MVGSDDEISAYGHGGHSEESSPCGSEDPQKRRPVEYKVRLGSGSQYSTGRNCAYATMVFISIVLSTILALNFRWQTGEHASWIQPAISTAKAEDLWCGKPYKPGRPSVPVGGRFPIPQTNSEPRLDFRCWPGLKPYVFGEDLTGDFIVDAPLSHQNGIPFKGSKTSDKLSIKVGVYDDEGAITPISSTSRSSTIPFNSTGNTIPFKFPSNLQPRAEPYSFSCVATNTRTGQIFSNDFKLSYLPPNPYGGRTVKMDRRTGTLLVKPTGARKYEPILPFGFYTSYGGYIEGDLGKLDDIKAKGYNMVHLVPPFDGVEKALDRMEQLGLWFIYDMRWTFQNLTSVEEQVLSIRGRPNLLVWYTSDEPDGWVYPLDKPKLAAEKIKELDAYHPVSVVLNCGDYYFKESDYRSSRYTEGADIVMHDTYPVGINATYSRVWDTPCTEDYGDCGCDNCDDRDIGIDIAKRVGEFKNRARWMGQERSLSVWSVPQAFGEQTYWPRQPDGKEFVVMSLVAIIHGSLGINPWLYPSTGDIDNSASTLARVVPIMSKYMFTAGSSHVIISSPDDIIHVATWKSQQGVMLVAANAGRQARSITLPDDLIGRKRGKTVFESGAGNSILQEVDRRMLKMEGLGAVIMVFYNQ